MKQHAPSLALVAIGALVVLGTLLAPAADPLASGGPSAENAAVVTADVKALEAGLSRLRRPAEAGRAAEVRRELAGLESAWRGLRAGLAARGLERIPAGLAFERGLEVLRASPDGDRQALARDVDALGAALDRVRAALRGAVVVEVEALALALGGLLGVWATLVLALPPLADVLSLKQ